MRRASMLQMGSLSSYRYGVDTYDSTKLGLGKLMVQNAGSGESAWAGPSPVGLARPMEQSTAIASQFPWAMQWQANAAGDLDWVFFADLSTAAATRRINAYTYNRRTGIFTWKGFVTVTYPGTSEAKTVRAQRMTYTKHTAGTVSVSGTAVTGTSTTWKTDGACVGNRIGFGSTDPTQIATWYEISAMASDGSITLASTAGTIAGGTPYVIEDLRCIQLLTSVTTSNGGLYVIKGLNWSKFSNVGGTVPAGATTDNIRASYFLKGAATGTALVGFGMGLQTSGVTMDSQMCYFLETLADPVVFKFNIRGPLTLTSGADTSQFQFKTGSGGALTGTPTQLNNGRLATLSHGPHSGVETLYFTTASRVYAAPTSGITNGSTTWLSNGSVMTEVPPGGVNTFAATGAISALEYMDSIDKLAVVTSATGRNYITQYRTDNGQLDRLFGVNTLQIDQSTADASTTPVPSQTGGAYSIWCEGGIAYIAMAGTTAIINRVYAIPLGADWEYAASTGARLVLPKIATADADHFVAFYAQNVQVLGGASGKNLGLNTEPYRMYYRTTGIDDNSGSWTLLDSTGIANVAAATSVQLMLEFRTIGTLSIPARICTAGVIYDDTGMSNYWQGSSNIGTSIGSKQFGFRHAVAYGTTVPRLKVQLFDAESGASLGTDDSTTQAWTWEKSTNAGGAWSAYNTTDRANADTYVRITPTSLADNIKVRAVLREY